MAENAMAGVPSSLPLSTTFLSKPHSSTVEADGRQESRWFGYRLVPIYPFAPLQLQLQISQEAQELASAQMMVRAWRAKNRSPLCGEETWPLHINTPAVMVTMLCDSLDSLDCSCWLIPALKSSGQTSNKSSPRINRALLQ